MKVIILLASCLAVSACSAFGLDPRSSPGQYSASLPGSYGGAYHSYPNGAQIRRSSNGPYGVYSRHYLRSRHTSTYGYSPGFYRSLAHGHSSSVTPGFSHDPLHNSSLLGEHRYSLNFDNRHGRYGNKHRRPH